MLLKGELKRMEKIDKELICSLENEVKVIQKEVLEKYNEEKEEFQKSYYEELNEYLLENGFKVKSKDEYFIEYANEAMLFKITRNRTGKSKKIIYSNHEKTIEFEIRLEDKYIKSYERYLTLNFQFISEEEKIINRLKEEKKAYLICKNRLKNLEFNYFISNKSNKKRFAKIEELIKFIVAY